MDTTAMRHRLDQQLRHDLTPPVGCMVERDEGSVRVISADPDGWSGVVWSNADETTADSLIARERARFAELPHQWEWKYYAHDTPADLPRRLLAAGFRADPAESVLVADTSAVTEQVTAEVAPPPGVRLEPVTDSDGVELLVRVHDEVFGGDHAGLGRQLTAGIEQAPDTIAAVLALAGNRPVAAGRIEFHQGTEFASLWGGGTVADWRGRGLFRAVVGYRVRLAAGRGFGLIQVDAAPTSAPILRRLGFAEITSTTPFVLDPSAGRDR